MTDRQTVLKVLLRQRHQQTHTAFIREYDKVAADLDAHLSGRGPSKAQFYRWLSGEVASLPYADHCRVLEAMFPGWTVENLFQKHEGGIEFVPEPSRASEPGMQPGPSPAAPAPPTTIGSDNSPVLGFYQHRSDTPKQLWMDLLTQASDSIDLFANASLFLPEDNPEAIAIIRKKAESGVKVRILLADPDNPAAALRGREERLFDAIPGRIRMAIAYYRPLVDVAGIEFRLHGTSLYNSIFRYGDQMLVNQHIYGTYGYLAPILHLRKVDGADLFETYMRSFEMIWNEESFDFHTKEPLHRS